jgi:hypothetical protein
LLGFVGIWCFDESKKHLNTGTTTNPHSLAGVPILAGMPKN